MTRQRGTTLIEVLMSLLILAIGLLGMLGLQTVSLRNTQTAYFRTQATVMTADIIERMRANAQGVRAGSYDDAVGALTAACLTVAGCAPHVMAGHDIAEWQAALQADLPSGTGVVCIDSTSDDGTPVADACDGIGMNHVVKVWWDDNRDGTANQRAIISLRF